MKKTFNYPQYEDYLQLAHSLAKKRRKIFQNILFFILALIIGYFLLLLVHRIIGNNIFDTDQVKLYFSIAIGVYALIVILFLRRLPFGRPSRKDELILLTKLFKRKEIFFASQVENAEDDLAALRDEIKIKKLAIERAKEAQAAFQEVILLRGRDKESTEENIDENQ